MSDNQTLPESGDFRERITRLEAGLRHSQKIHEIQDGHIRDAFTRVEERNRRQDQHLAMLEERMLAKIEVIYALLWSGIRWGAVFFGTTLLGVVLKALNLI